MYALGLYNVLTPGDLTGGRTIAGTGTISMDGTVGPIGGIADKVVAARHAGASIFLVPKQNMTELQGVDTGTMKLVPVGTFQDALTALGVPAAPSMKAKVAA
jgi:PDZ domain-containing protein